MNVRDRVGSSLGGREPCACMRRGVIVRGPGMSAVIVRGAAVPPATRGGGVIVRATTGGGVIVREIVGVLGRLGISVGRWRPGLHSVVRVRVEMSSIVAGLRMLVVSARVDGVGTASET